MNSLRGKIWPELLSEGLSEDLYHVTKHPSNVLGSDELIPSLSMGQDDSHKLGQAYISFARTPTSLYLYTSPKEMQVILHVDGRKVGHKHKGTPFEYGDATIRMQNAKRDVESEDRVFLRGDVTLRPLHKYLKGIYCVIGNDIHGIMHKLPSNSNSKSTLRLLKGYQDKYSVPVHVVIHQPNSRVRVTDVMKSTPPLLKAAKPLDDYLEGIEFVVDDSQPPIDDPDSLRTIGPQLRTAIHALVLGWYSMSDDNFYDMKGFLELRDRTNRIALSYIEQVLRSKGMVVWNKEVYGHSYVKAAYQWIRRNAEMRAQPPDHEAVLSKLPERVAQVYI